MASKVKDKPKNTQKPNTTGRLSTSTANELHNTNADSKSEDSKITVSFHELRNLIRQEVSQQLDTLKDSLSQTFTELRSDLALRLDLIDNRVNDVLKNNNGSKRDLISKIKKMNEESHKSINEINSTLSVLYKNEDLKILFTTKLVDITSELNITNISLKEINKNYIEMKKSLADTMQKNALTSDTLADELKVITSVVQEKKPMSAL